MENKFKTIDSNDSPSSIQISIIELSRIRYWNAIFKDNILFPMLRK